MNSNIETIIVKYLPNVTCGKAIVVENGNYENFVNQGMECFTFLYEIIWAHGNRIFTLYFLILVREAFQIENTVQLKYFDAKHLAEISEKAVNFHVWKNRSDKDFILHISQESEANITTTDAGQREFRPNSSVEEIGEILKKKLMEENLGFVMTATTLNRRNERAVLKCATELLIHEEGLYPPKNVKERMAEAVHQIVASLSKVCELILFHFYK